MPGDQEKCISQDAVTESSKKITDGQKGDWTEKKKRVMSVLYFWFQTNEEVTRELETQPTASHTGSDLEKVGGNTLVKTLETLVLDDHSDGIEH
ncbi:hypothetical protein KCU70_g334, partial [Aureobasidium melanogenum]